MRRPVAFIAAPSGGATEEIAVRHVDRAALLSAMARRHGVAPVLLDYALEQPDGVLGAEAVAGNRACAESVARTIGADTSSELWILLRDGASFCDGTVSGYAIEWHRGRGSPGGGPGALLKGRGVRSGTWAEWESMADACGLRREWHILWDPARRIGEVPRG